MMLLCRLFLFFMVLALVGSLVLNFTLLSKMNQLEQQVGVISGSQQDIYSNGDTFEKEIY